MLNDYKRLYALAEAQHFVARSSGVAIACAGAFLKSYHFTCLIKLYGFVLDEDVGY